MSDHNPSREACLRDLLTMARPIDDVLADLAAWGWDSRGIIKLERRHVLNVLRSYLQGRITPAVEQWANAIEQRDDIAQEDALIEAVSTLANPAIEGPLTPARASAILDALSQAA